MISISYINQPSSLFVIGYHKSSLTDNWILRILAAVAIDVTNIRYIYALQYLPKTKYWVRGQYFDPEGEYFKLEHEAPPSSQV